jgi:hypothetical protein
MFTTTDDVAPPAAPDARTPPISATALGDQHLHEVSPSFYAAAASTYTTRPQAPCTYKWK